uniref:Uncharacterized protein n=1 Tax=Caenorhabditis tropicalis TaxID=1561998 RepID=A0A1I7TCX1_9PELO
MRNGTEGPRRGKRQQHDENMMSRQEHNVPISSRLIIIPFRVSSNLLFHLPTATCSFCHLWIVPVLFQQSDIAFPSFNYRIIDGGRR